MIGLITYKIPSPVWAGKIVGVDPGPEALFTVYIPIVILEM